MNLHAHQCDQTKLQLTISKPKKCLALEKWRSMVDRKR